MESKLLKGTSITTVLALAFFILSAIVLFASSSLQMISAVQTQQESISRQQQLIANEASRSVSGFIQEGIRVLQTAVMLTDLIRTNEADLEEVLGLLRAQYSAFRSIYVWNSGKKMLGISSKVSLVEAMKYKADFMNFALSELKSRDKFFSDVYIDTNNMEPRILAGIPIADSLGNRTGSIIAEVNLTYMWQLIDSLRVGEKGQVYVTDRKGNLIAFGDTGRILKGENVSGIPKVAEFLNTDKSGHGTTDMYTGINNTLVAGTFVPLGTPDWAVITEIPWEEAYSSVIQQGIWTAAIALIMAIIAGIVGIVIARIIAIPLVRLMEAANKIKGGNFGVEAEVSGPREVKSLAAVFNGMTSTLREMIGNLETRSAYLTGTVKRYEEHMSSVVSGNLLARVDIGSAVKEEEDPLVVLGTRLNETTSGLQEMIVRIRDAANNMESVSTEILSEVSKQTRGVNEQTSAIVSTTSNVDRIRSIAATTSDKANEVNEISKKTMAISMNGQKAVQAAIQSMYGMKDLVGGIAENLDVLSKHTTQIEEITSTVSEIASQSGILAMNAEIEAAHAGVHGKGFSVVAAEVGTLAQQSREATEEIQNLLAEIQKATHSTVEAMDNGIKGVEEGVVLATQAKNTIDQLSAAIMLSANAVNQMSIGSKDQAAEIDQIARAMHNITSVMEAGANAILITEGAVGNLNKLAKNLNHAVEQYKA